jgi:hypothetical protein
VLDEYPRSGGTWLTFMLGELIFSRTLDFESEREFIPAVGWHRQAPRPLPSGGRLLRTHEPFRADYPKAIYVVRHVGDVAVSYFNWWKWARVEDVEFKPFFRAFLSGHVDGYGPWHRHVASWLDVVDRPVHMVRYEDLRQVTEATLRHILDFLGLSAADTDISSAVLRNSLEEMRRKQERARASVFRSRAPDRDVVRKGSIGGWRDWLDREDVRLMERHAGPTLTRLGYTVGADRD